MLGAVLLLAAVGWAVRAQAGERTVVVTMRHSRFEPSALSAREGERVTFVVRNADPMRPSSRDAYHGARVAVKRVAGGRVL